MYHQHLSRRRFQQQLAALAGATLTSTWAVSTAPAGDSKSFALRYIVASAMYGKAALEEILPEVAKCGAEYLEIWAERHGNQREQIDVLGVDETRRLFEKYHVKLGSFTCFKYGIFNMQDEMKLVKALGGDMVICNTPKPAAEHADNLERAVAVFAEALKPHVDIAEQLGITIGVENHGGGVIASPESVLMLMEAIPSPHLGLAMAPYHLPQDTAVIGQLIRDLGNRLVHFQAWEHGKGCMTPLPKPLELMQLPHRGPLDWVPILAALRDIDYRGRTEIFMHPTPRGIPILPTTAEVTAEINQSRDYLAACLTQI